MSKKPQAWRLTRRTLLLTLICGVSFVGLGTTGYAVHGSKVTGTLSRNTQHVKQSPHAKKQSVERVPQAPDYTIPPITNGLAPVLSTIPTKQNVVFLGIDDGANKEQFELDMMIEHDVKASLFLANRFISEDPEFFNAFTEQGSVIENHSVNHILLSNLSYEEQKREICDEAVKQFEQFGRRPVLFRPPGGDYNQDTQRAAAACGMKAIILWIAKANGGKMEYQDGNSLKPGDIVLMHFRPEFEEDMQSFLDAQDAAGLHTELLEDWLAPDDLGSHRHHEL